MHVEEAPGVWQLLGDLVKSVARVTEVPGMEIDLSTWLAVGAQTHGTTGVHLASTVAERKGGRRSRPTGELPLGFGREPVGLPGLQMARLVFEIRQSAAEEFRVIPCHAHRRKPIATTDKVIAANF